MQKTPLHPPGGGRGLIAGYLRRNPQTKYVLPAMVAVHAVIGVGEALITVATLSVILAARPDVVGEWHGTPAALASGESPS